MTTPQKVLLIAQACHAINCGLQAAIGEAATAWNNAPESVRHSTVVGVEYFLDNPDVTPEQSHAAWLKYRVDTGWVLGAVKDVEKKIHPNLVPFEQLSFEQKAKDYVFSAAVRALKDLPLEQLQVGASDANKGAIEAAQNAAALNPQSPANLVLPRGFVAVQYVGKRETYREGTYGTGLMFTRGQTLPVPIAAATKMLLHPDVYVPGHIEEAKPEEASEAIASIKPTQPEKDKEEETQQEHRDSVMRMTTKEALATFAKTNFQQDLDRRLKVSDLQAQVITMIDRFGVPK
jgi:hypothetical protein